MTTTWASKLLTMIAVLAVILSAGMLLPAIGQNNDGTEETTIEGYLYGREGTYPKPIANAQVTLTNVHTGEMFYAMTEGSGRFIFQDLYGTFVANASANGYFEDGDDRTQPFTVKRGEYFVVPEDLVLIRLPNYVGSAKYRSFSGYVLRAGLGDDPAIGGANITLFPTDPTYHKAVIRGTSQIGNKTDHGIFKISAFSGEFWLLCVAEDYNVFYQKVDITDNKTMNITLTPGTPEPQGLVQGWVRSKTRGDVGIVAADLYDTINTSRHLSGSDPGNIIEGNYFNFRTYYGNYKLVLTFEQHQTYFNSSIVLSANTPTISMTDIKVSYISNPEYLPPGPTVKNVYSTLTFPNNDFNTTKLDTTWTLYQTSSLYDLVDHPTGNPRWEIDRQFGNGDGDLTSTELAAFNAYLPLRNTRYLDLEDLFVIFNFSNETSYDLVSVAITAQDDFLGDVGSLDTMTLTTSATYTLQDKDIDMNRSMKFYTRNLRPNQDLTVKLPDDWEVVGKFTEDDVEIIDVETVIMHSSFHAGVDIRPQEAPLINITIRDANVVGDKHYLTKPGSDLEFDVLLMSDSEIENYTWDFGDGDNAYNQTTFHNYSAGGRVDVRCTATATNGLSTTDNVTLDVDNAPPVPEISVELQDIVEDPVSGTISQHTVVTDNTVDEGVEVMFNGSASTDLIVAGKPYEGSIRSHKWDFGDMAGGGELPPPTVGEIVYHLFSMPGTFNVTLTVTDEVDLSANKTIQVTVRDKVGIQVVINVTDQISIDGVGGITIDVNQSTDNYDADLSVMTFKWKFGLTDIEQETLDAIDWDEEDFDGLYVKGKDLLTIFTKPGMYYFAVNATDSSGNWVVAPKSVQVKGFDLEVVKIDAEKNKVEEGEKLVITVNVSNVGIVEATNIEVTLYDGEKKVKSHTIDSLESLGATEGEIIEFTWTAKDDREHKFYVNITSNDNPDWEENWFNNEGNFTIIVDPEPTSSWIYVVIIIIIIIIVMGAIWARRRGMLGSGRKRDRGKAKKEKGKDKRAKGKSKGKEPKKESKKETKGKKGKKK